MKHLLLITVFAASTFAHGQTTPTPAACASKSANFDVKLDESQHALLSPEAGKARVYFIQDLGPVSCIGSCGTTRIGVDGAWVGANQHNSYFSVTVEAGEHHLCANPQSHFASVTRFVALAHFTAEPGKTYYFRTRTLGGKDNPSFDLDPVDSDQAEYLIASYPLSVSHLKQ